MMPSSISTMWVLLTILVIGLASCAKGNNPPNTIHNTTVSALTPLPGWPQAPVITASFEPEATNQGYDSNGDGHFDYLLVDVTVQVKEAGGFGFSAFLLDEQGELIATGNMIKDELRNAPVMNAELILGPNKLSFYFNGQTIRNASQDGPYQVTLGLFDEAGAILDSVELVTGQFNRRDFK